jgi:hypothetical protein
VSGCLIGVHSCTVQVVHSVEPLTFQYSPAIGISATNGKSAHWYHSAIAGKNVAFLFAKSISLSKVTY